VDGRRRDQGRRGGLQPSVRLAGGQLPGSAQVSGAASLESGPWPRSRIRLPSYSRAAIQLGIAVGAAIAVGDLLSGRRFYWAAIAAFVTLMGTNNTGEQVAGHASDHLLPQPLQGGLGLLPSGAHHHQVIAIPDQHAVPARVPRPVQPVQVDVAEQRGYHPANAMDNFCFDVTLSYRRLERPRRAEVSP